MDAEDEARDPKHLVLTPPAQKPKVYDYHVLEMARTSGELILNPRDVTVKSIFLADMDWRSDLYWHNLWIRHKHDLKHKDDT